MISNAHLIHDHDYVVLIADFPDARQETGRWCQEASFSLNWLNDNCCCVSRGAALLEQPLKALKRPIATLSGMVVLEGWDIGSDLNQNSYI